MSVTSKSLLDCPFCGGDVELDRMRAFRALHDSHVGNAVAIYCLKCSAEMSMCYEDFPEYEVESLATILRDAWNLRQG
jgi:hypothetical protein